MTEHEMYLRANLTASIPFGELEKLIDAYKDGRAPILPKGKVGEYVEWNNGIANRIYAIHALLICYDGIRYDLGDFAPFVDHPNIAGILTREEADDALERMNDNDNK